MPKVIIILGGTGGHIFPGIALGEYLEERRWEVKYLILGSKLSLKGLEEKVIGSYQFGSPLGKNVLKNVNNVLKILKTGFKISKMLFSDFVIIPGSYASLPVLLNRHRLKLYAMEQNFIPGRVIRLASQLKVPIFVGFEESKNYLHYKSIYTGVPIRKEVKKRYEKKVARKELNIPEGFKLYIGVIGGSLGARYMVEKLFKTLILRHKDVFFYVQAGRYFDEIAKEFGEEGENFKIFRFCTKMAELYSAMDGFITRAGASTLYELSYHSKPAILIPYPYAADNHQYFNALSLYKKGAALLIEEREIEEKIEKIFRQFRENLEQYSQAIFKALPHNAEEKMYRELKNDLEKN